MSIKSTKEAALSTSLMPAEPTSRRVIAVLDQHDIEKCSRTGETQILNDPQTHILAYPVKREQATKALSNIIDAGLSLPGSILIQSPFDPDEYADAAEAVERFALAKHMLFSNFCQLLGATRVIVTQVDVVTSDSVQTITADGGRLMTKSKLGIKRAASDSLSSQLSLEDEYKGGTPDLEAAELLLSKHRLAGDSNMRSLLQARSSPSNPINKRTLTLNLSTEASRNLKVASKLKLPTFSFNADYQVALSHAKEYTLTMEVFFEN
ncbi:hypothetical protein SKA58_16808 [Sphingomonas sp. SKA58]|uniref:hypothetical protein n=1 Tax=Sphingomonas sp. (strain SKA58) TaxID=314266 RepID=UPI0000D7A651|nr:hypothetical protein [Sphingomonas sp. SKA58]EAT08858.1 hypothetical protein SKA58_16808 [Sphingomonas sp. SKA58]